MPPPLVDLRAHKRCLYPCNGLGYRKGYPRLRDYRHATHSSDDCTFPSLHFPILSTIFPSPSWNCVKIFRSRIRGRLIDEIVWNWRIFHAASSVTRLVFLVYTFCNNYIMLECDRRIRHIFYTSMRWVNICLFLLIILINNQNSSFTLHFQKIFG